MGRLPFEVERKLVVKAKASTDPRYGKRPEERDIRDHITYGVINLDKPAGPTSHEVVSWVKKILELKKAGHGGTLDPKVTGILPIALEESTKVIQTLLPAGKEYMCIMRLHAEVEEEKIKEIFKEFQGEILQKPPVKSAVKRQLRKRKIYYLEVQEIEGRDILFKVGCEAGTYIRKLCHDIGEAIGCGAHMLELRRTKSGSFTEKDIVTLHDVMDAYSFWKEEGNQGFLRKTILPVEKAVEYLPKIVVKDGAVDAICHGAELAVPGVCKLDAEIDKGDPVALFTLKDELIAIGEATMDTKAILIEESGITVKTKRVVMRPGTYPKMWKSLS
jgi:H/ACA ribonucleoprotein complex subunit 4